MALPAWWEIATPDKDIREGFLDERVLAADLGDVLERHPGKGFSPSDPDKPQRKGERLCRLLKIG